MLTVEICMGTSCHLMGVQELMDVLEALPDDQRQQIEIKGITCFKKCGKGPNIRINGEMLDNATPDRLREILLTILQ